MRHLLDIPDYHLEGFKREAGKIRLYGKSKPPPAPDYSAAANITSTNNLDVARLTAQENKWLAQFTADRNQEFARNQLKANRANQVNQDGTLTWTHTGDDPDSGWTETTSLNPAAQAIYNKQQALSGAYADTALTGFDKIKGLLSDPNLDMSDPRLSMDGAPKRAIDVGQTAQDAIMARLNPQFKNQEADLQNRMANQGITLGSDAYSREMNQFQSGRNDAMSQAALQGIGLDRQNRQDFMQDRSNALQEIMQLKDRPLNLVNALRSGAQVNAPQFGNYAQQSGVTQQTPQMQTVGGADMLGAAEKQYGASMSAFNAKQAQQQSLMQGLFGLGSSLFG